MRHIAALAGKGLDQEAAEAVIAYARDQRRLEAQASAAKSGIRRRAAEIFRKTGHVLQSRTDLLSVEIDREATEANHVELASGGEAGRVLHGIDDARNCAEALPYSALEMAILSSTAVGIQFVARVQGSICIRRSALLSVS